MHTCPGRRALAPGRKRFGCLLHGEAGRPAAGPPEGAPRGRGRRIPARRHPRPGALALGAGREAGEPARARAPALTAGRVESGVGNDAPCHRVLPAPSSRLPSGAGGRARAGNPHGRVVPPRPGELRPLARCPGHRHARACERAHLRRYITELRGRGLSARSTARALAALRGLFRYLLERGVTREDPTLELESPKLMRPLPALPVELRRWTPCWRRPMSSKPLGLRDRAMLETLYATGVRVSELVSLTLGQLRLDPGYVQGVGEGRQGADRARGLQGARVAGALSGGRTAQPSTRSTRIRLPHRAGEWQ